MKEFLRTAKFRLLEFIKYDFNQFKFPLILFVNIAIFTLKILGKHEKAFSVASNVFRTGWSGSFHIGKRNAVYYFIDNKKLGIKLSQSYIDSQLPLPNTQKFYNEPVKMLDGIITVLQNPSVTQKGVLIINYSYYFPLFIRFYDVKIIAERFHIVLEPSWAGFCEENILLYTQFEFPVFLQTYEKRDLAFINSLNSNIIPVSVGPSWFINHNNFAEPNPDDVRDIDVIMVAAWASFKRHAAFFKAISPIIKSQPDLKIVLIGYPVDLTKQDILKAAEKFGLLNNIIIYEWITPQEVAAMQRRAKVNVLWSKFEGNNRAIIEGMFCGTPVIMRQGHNYGEEYDFINIQTGSFANENSLVDAVKNVITNRLDYNPREYVMKNRNCIEGTKKIADSITAYELKTNNPDWLPDLAIKVNDLHGMTYFDRNSKDYQMSYRWLATKQLTCK